MSSRNCWTVAADLDQTTTRSIGNTLDRYATCSRASCPAPTSPRTELSGRARCREATALAAAVRSRVGIFPSMTARHSPVDAEFTMIIDRCAGNPRSRLDGMSAMNFTTARSWRAETAVMGRNLASEPGASRVVIGGWTDTPVARSACACSTASMTSFVLSRSSTSDADKNSVIGGSFR